MKNGQSYYGTIQRAVNTNEDAGASEKGITRKMKAATLPEFYDPPVNLILIETYLSKAGMFSAQQINALVQRCI